MKKKVLISVIIVSLVIIIGSAGYILGTRAQTPATATDSHQNTEAVFTKKSGLTGIYASSSSSPSVAQAVFNGRVIELNGLVIDPDTVTIIRGAMQSPLDLPPLIRIPLTNTTDRTIEIRKNPKSGQYGVQVESRDKDGHPVDINAWVFMAELDLPPKVSTSINAELISSLETKGFAIYAFYKK